MRIPEVREEMRAIARTMRTIAGGQGTARDLVAQAIRLEGLVEELERRRADRRAPVGSDPITPELQEEIRAFAALHPTWSQADIGAQFNVNAGRVSEALKGRRT